MEDGRGAEVERVLRDREVRGLWVPLVWRIVFLTFALAYMCFSVTFAPDDTRPAIDAAIFAALLTVGGTNLWLLWLLKKQLRLDLVGVTGALCDAGLVLAFCAVAVLAGQDEGLNPAYVFETELPVVVLTIVAINGLALRPRYPLMVGAGVMIGLSVAAVMGWLAPGAELGGERVDFYTGAAIDPGNVIGTLIASTGLISAVSYAAHAARRTLREGIEKELEHARQQQAQLALAMREKVQSIARLVAGVSHEINTPLGALSSGLQTQARVLEKLADLEPAEPAAAKRSARSIKAGRAGLQAMQAASARIAEVERSLRALAHLDEADYQKVELPAELSAVIARVAPGAAARVQVELPPLPALYLSASAFNQALMSLLAWSLERAGPEGAVRVTGAVDAQAVQLELRDSGPALPADALRALFEVGFAGEGGRVSASLGMAAAQGVITRHGGELQALPADDAGGTRLRLRLPRPS